MSASQCYTCKHWGGDKAKVRAMIVENPTSMDRKNGWPPDAPCGLSYDWATICIEGDAVATLEVPANFGCIYWEAE